MNETLTLTTYRMLIDAAPYPYQGAAQADTPKEAAKKIAKEARRAGLRISRGPKILEIETI